MIEPRVELVFQKVRKGKGITPYAVKIGDMVLPVLSYTLNWNEGTTGVLEIAVSLNIVDLEIIKETDMSVGSKTTHKVVETTTFVKKE